MSLDLRPLSLGELLDRSFSLYRRHFWLFVGLMAPPSVFTLLLGIASELFARVPVVMGGSGEADPMALGLTIVGGAVVFAVMFVGYWMAYMVALGTTTVAVSELYLERPATSAGAYRRVRGAVGRLMLLTLLIGLRLFALAAGVAIAIGIVLVGFAVLLRVAGGSSMFAAVAGLAAVVAFMLLGVGLFIFALRYSIAVPALVLEGVTAGEAIRRSVFLTQGSRFRAGVLVVFATVITFAAFAIFQGPFIAGAGIAGPESRTAFWLQLAGAVTGSVGGAITGPLMIIALALLYYDIRIRREGLDVELMLASLDAEPAGAQA